MASTASEALLAMMLDMRTVACLLIFLAGCSAQRPEDKILAVYQQMEKAEQKGDADTLIGLFSREAAPNAEKMRPYIRPRPDVHYASSKVHVQGDEAVLLGQSGKDQFVRIRFVREDGRWKIKDQTGSNIPYHPDSVYALLPPPAGAFERAGASWQKIAPAFDAAHAATYGWQVRATSDESFLYVRIESSAPIPAPGTEAQTPPSGWPVMKVGVSGVGEFVLRASANIGDNATFDKSGHADGHRQSVNYLLWLEHAKQTVFAIFADPRADHQLIQAGDHFFDVRVPLRSMGIADSAHTKITIGDAQWPKSALFSLDVHPYR